MMKKFEGIWDIREFSDKAYRCTDALPSIHLSTAHVTPVISLINQGLFL